MPSLDDVYRKFGEVAEAAQLLETEIGNLLIESKFSEASIEAIPTPELAKHIVDNVNQATVGRLLTQLGKFFDTSEKLRSMFENALNERNRLTHSFYRQHNFRKFEEPGLEMMLQDLKEIHLVLLAAYDVALKLSGVDLGSLDGEIEIPKKWRKL